MCTRTSLIFYKHWLMELQDSQGRVSRGWRGCSRLRAEREGRHRVRRSRDDRQLRAEGHRAVVVKPGGWEGAPGQLR